MILCEITSSSLVFLFVSLYNYKKRTYGKKTPPFTTTDYFSILFCCFLCKGKILTGFLCNSILMVLRYEKKSISNCL